MPTRLTKPVVREVGDGNDRAVVMMTREGLYIRARNARTWFGPLHYGALLLNAADRMTGKPAVVKPRPRRRKGGVSRGLLTT